MMMSVKRSIIPEADSKGVKNSCISKIIEGKDNGLGEKKRPAVAGRFDLIFYLLAYILRHLVPDSTFSLLCLLLVQVQPSVSLYPVALPVAFLVEDAEAVFPFQ
jgi:hypothetical protein